MRSRDEIAALVFERLEQLLNVNFIHPSLSNKATTAKFGEPSYKNPPNEMRWKADTTKLKANCDRAHCEIVVEDSAFEQAENEQQGQTDSKSRHQSASDPKL